jgi:hypothetical protein
VILRDEPSPLLAPNTLCFDVPFGYGEGRARLEILFDTPRLSGASSARSTTGVVRSSTLPPSSPP